MIDDRIDLRPAAEAKPVPSKADLLGYIAALTGELALTALTHREMFLNYLLRIVSEEALARARAEHRGVMEGEITEH